MTLLPHRDPGKMPQEHDNVSDAEDDPPDETSQPKSKIEDIWIAQQFIDALKDTSIYNGDLSQESIDYLLNPPAESLKLDEEPDHWHVSPHLCWTQQSIWQMLHKYN